MTNKQTEEVVMKTQKTKTETQLQRVIRRSESGEIAWGDVTIRVSVCGLSMTRFCSVKDFEETLEDMKNLPVKKLVKKLRTNVEKVEGGEVNG